jgi:hypothetical protein
VLYEDVPEVPGQITGEMLLTAAEQMIGRQVYDYVVQKDNYEGNADCAEFASERCQEVTGKASAQQLETVKWIALTSLVMACLGIVLRFLKI